MTAPNPLASPVFSQKVSNYSDLRQEATQDLMNTQLETNVPQPPSDVFSIVSDPLIPDRTVADRLGNMDPELYDLRDTSNLIKLISALLGGAGVGGLRKQTAVARLENAFATTHFLDLDRFYGALFGIVRTEAEVMPDFGALTDDSGTLPQAQPATVTYTLHRDADMGAATVSPGGPFTLGEEFEVTAPLLVSSLRYWRASTAYVASQMVIYSVDTQAPISGTTVTPVNPPATAPAWHTTALGSPVLLSPGRYVVAALFPSGYSYVGSLFASGGPVGVSAPAGPATLLSQADATNGLQGRFNSGASAAFPATLSAGAGWGVDLVYTAATTSTVAGGRQFDPYTDAAGSDVWDDVHSRDASYRSRLIKFAKAIPQGGTYGGLLAAAEAILAVECECYESWTWVDDTADHGGVVMATGYTWGQIERGFKSYAAVERGHTWATFAGRILTLGRTGTSNRSEVLIQPKRAIRQDEKFQLMRVLNALKPAGVSITIDPQGLAVHDPIAIRGVAADSEYWEVTSKVVPNTTVSATGQSVYQVTDPGKSQPRPAFSQYTGEAWTYNNDVTTVTSYAMQDSRSLTASDFETVVYGDGTTHRYQPSDSLVPGAHAAGARAGADGVLTSYPYPPGRNQPNNRGVRR